MKIGLSGKQLSQDPVQSIDQVFYTLKNRLAGAIDKKSPPSGRPVRAIGLEPTCLAAPDPKSGASANFAMPAVIMIRCPKISQIYLPDSQEYRLWATLTRR
jgi:hypothetical protein